LRRAIHPVRTHPARGRERILVGNITSGERFETYAIPAEAGSGRVALNGAAAHLGKVGDRLVIMAFAVVGETEAAGWTPRKVTIGNDNLSILKEF